MTWNLNSDRPIYSQIMDKIKLDIVSGKYQPGNKMPSVRELAADASVNPNTMQKALSELEREGLLYSQRTSGRFISEDKEAINNIKKQLAMEEIKDFLAKMRLFGYSDGEILALVKKIDKGETNEQHTWI